MGLVGTRAFVIVPPGSTGILKARVHLYVHTMQADAGTEKNRKPCRGHVSHVAKAKRGKECVPSAVTCNTPATVTHAYHLISKSHGSTLPPCYQTPRKQSFGGWLADWGQK